MTDKQIIIDGVDVSGCEFFDSGNCVECDMRVHFYGDIPCDDECNRNCHYKNWQRKEQECEELNKELHKNFKEKDTLHLIIDRLLEASGYDTNTATAEDFEDVYEHMRYEQQQLDQLKAENEELKKKCNIYTCGICGNKEDCNKLYKTLTEIKELCKRQDLNQGSRCIHILQKISECEVE